MATVKVLLSSKDGTAFHESAVIVEVELPDGYRRVFRGALKPGDLFLNARLAPDVIQWEPLKKLPSMSDAMRDEINSTAKWFACLIRCDGGEVDIPCERCEVEPRRGKNRFCTGCCYDIVSIGREKP